MTLETQTAAALKRTRAAGRALALATGEQKNRALGILAALIRRSGEGILSANRDDLERARVAGKSGAFVERLTLNPARIEAMAKGVDEVAALPDPVGEVIESWRRPNGLEIVKRRVPIGTIAVIYESRPNVTIDAGGLCLK